MRNKDYRELQISSSQLVIIFLAIIVLGIAIFLLGVSVGKKQTQIMSETQLPIKSKPERVVAKNPQVNEAQKKTEQKPEQKPEQKTELKTEQKPEQKPSTTPAKKTANPISKEIASHQTQTKPPTSKSVTPAASASQFYIQVGAYRNREGAYSRAEELKSRGFPAEVTDPSPTSRNQLYKVQIGGYNSHDEADQQLGELARIENKPKTDYFIVQR